MTFPDLLGTGLDFMLEKERIKAANQYPQNQSANEKIVADSYARTVGSVASQPVADPTAPPLSFWGKYGKQIGIGLGISLATAALVKIGGKVFK